MNDKSATQPSSREAISPDRPEVSREPLDFTGMYATHDAFRRDLGRLGAAVHAGKAGSPQVRAGWEVFKAQLHLHHGVEDTILWPALRRAVADRPGDIALTDEMVAEHDRLDPLLTAVDETLTGARVDLGSRTRELSAALNRHLTHEEESALPLIQSVLTPADWRRFTAQMRRRQGVKGAAVYVPWLLDGTPTPAQHRFWAALPAPVRFVNALVWEPRYRRRNLWSFGGSIRRTQ